MRLALKCPRCQGRLFVETVAEALEDDGFIRYSLELKCVNCGRAYVGRPSARPQPS